MPGRMRFEWPSYMPGTRERIRASAWCFAPRGAVRVRCTSRAFEGNDQTAQGEGLRCAVYRSPEDGSLRAARGLRRSCELDDPTKKGTSSQTRVLDDI